jgi:hypothetical protein
LVKEEHAVLTSMVGDTGAADAAVGEVAEHLKEVVLEDRKTINYKA